MSSKCCVCTDPETSKNPVFNCVDCGVGVHKLCYGINSNYTDLWLCSSFFLFPICELCLTSGGALKKTTSKGKWVHVICALFTEGVKFENNNQMEPVNILKIPEIQRNQKCVFCTKTHGICCECTQPNCANWLHITCAQKFNCLREVIGKKNKINFESYCSQHMPIDGSTRRISSNFVREQIREKSPTSLQAAYKLVYDVDVSGISVSIGTNNFSNYGLKKTNANDASEVIEDDPSDKTDAIQVHPNASPFQCSDTLEDHCNATSNLASVSKDDTVSEIASAILQQYDEWNFSQGLQSTTKEVYEFEARLRRKDEKIATLKSKKNDLKRKVNDLQGVNSNLESQILKLTSQLSQISISKTLEVVNCHSFMEPLSKAKQDHLNVLKNRITSKKSDDGSEIIYANGVKASARLMRQIETISGEEASDRRYVNDIFFIIFSEKYVTKQAKKGLSWEEVLSKFRESNRHELMRDLYEYRVVRSGLGDIDARLRLFKLAFRTKLYNWWISNMPKITEKNPK